jgi:hypothetical protein
MAGGRLLTICQAPERLNSKSQISDLKFGRSLAAALLTAFLNSLSEISNSSFSTRSRPRRTKHLMTQIFAGVGLAERRL